MVKCGYVVLRWALAGTVAERGIISQPPGSGPSSRGDPLLLTSNRQSQRGRIHDYVGRHVMPSLGIAGRAFAIEPPPDSGTRSSLWLIRIEGMQPLLLRSFARRRQARASVTAMRHMEAHDLPAPRVVFDDIRIAPWLARLLGARGPHCVTIETWIDGPSHARLTEPAAVAAAALKTAELLARMHQVARDAWGRPDRPRADSFADHALGVARRMIRDLGRGGWLDPPARKRAGELLESFRDRVDAIRSFRLVHNDVNRHNVVVAADGHVALVDLHRIAYEPFPEEVLNASYHFCRKDPDLAARFEQTYFARAGDTMRRLFDETRGFFEPLHYLKKLHRRATILGRRGLAPDDAKLTRYLRGLLG